MHETILHGGVSSTLSKLREKFWLLRGRQVVRKILRKCVWCKRINGLPYRLAPVPNLPHSRLEQVRAFNSVGLDYCGPLRYSKGEEGRLEKCYVCLFTCTSTRALHLEVVPNMSTPAFLRALKRFTARRGVPRIISDNFSSFKRAFSELNAVSQNSTVRRHVADKRIIWDFITEYSPWEGGFYERMVKEVKDSLKKVLKFAILEYDELQTVIVEIEAVLNSRPLCYVGDEINEVITPSHFLVLKRLTSEPSSFPCVEEPNLLKMLKGSRRLLERFWSIWYERYVTSLRERSIKGPRSSDILPKVGDVVLLKESKPRLLWKIGRITSCRSGRDGAVRSATVQIMDGGGSPRLVRRPIRLLIPLESTSNVS